MSPQVLPEAGSQARGTMTCHLHRAAQETDTKVTDTAWESVTLKVGRSPSLCLPSDVPSTPALCLWAVWSWIPVSLPTPTPQCLTTYAELNWRCSEAAFSLFSEQAKRLDLLCLGRSSTMSSQVPAIWLMTTLGHTSPPFGVWLIYFQQNGYFFYPVWKLAV